MKTLDDKVKTEFEKNKYVKIPNGVSPTLIKFIDYYIELFSYRYETILELLPAYYNYAEHGLVLDKIGHPNAVAQNSFRKYGDLISESLLLGMRESIGKQIGLELVPTYSYFRIYTTGNELTKHSDRDSCEISITLCVGYEGEPWPIFIEGTPIYLEPGDMIIYRGCEVEHWREPFKDKRHTQIFLHYNDKNGPYGEDNLYDGRPFVGLADWTIDPKDPTFRRG